MPVSHAPRLHATLLAVLVLAPLATADPIAPPVPPPLAPPAAASVLNHPRPLASAQPPAAPASSPTAAPCQPAAAQQCQPTTLQPRIVVNVPPPEIVYRDEEPSGRVKSQQPRCGLFHRHCGHREQQNVQTHTTLTPLQGFTSGSSMTLLGGTGFNLGTANVGVGGLTFANVNPGFVTNVGTVQQVSSAASGLAAIHQAELYAASVSATRRQQDAELRVMMAALDRARGSMVSSVAAGQSGAASVAGCPELSCDALKGLLTATSTNTKQIAVVVQQMTTLQTKLDALAADVAELKKVQAATILDLQKLKTGGGAKGSSPIPVLPPDN